MRRGPAPVIMLAKSRSLGYPMRFSDEMS